MSIETAITFATQVHTGQLRRGSTLPYIVHPIEVMKKLSDFGITDQTTLIAAILHDTLEDVAKDKLSDTAKFIWDTFGDDVLDVVEQLTYLPEGGSKEIYIDGFKDKRPEAIVVKVVDRACNILDFRTAGKKDRAKAYAQQGLPLYQILTLGVYRETTRRLIIKYGEVTLTDLTLFAKHVWEK